MRFSLMRGVARWMVGAMLALVPAAVHAQSANPPLAAASVTPAGQARMATGRVLRPGPDSTTVPVPRQLVMLHRVGSDKAAPLDSMYTNAAGVYRFKYVTSGTADAVYFASARFAGIAYVTAPFQAPDVASPAGDLMVYDTTSAGAAVQVAGRHLVVAAPDASGIRQVTEVFDLANEGPRTIIARDSVTPVWTGPLPAGAQSPAVSGGDIAPAGTAFANGVVRVFAPVSPGIRQLAVTFGLPASAFPLHVPLDRGAGVVELLLEEESATPSMPGLAQQASVSTQGRNFKRYLAQAVQPGTMLTIRAGGTDAAARTRFIAGVVFAMAVIMALALIGALMRRRTALAPPASRA